MGKIKTAVFVSNCQPYHNGHKSLVDFALDKNDYLIVFLRERLGPARSKRAPWTYNERVDMVLAAHPLDEHRIMFSPHVDDPDEQAWTASLVGRAKCIAPPDSEIIYVGASPIKGLKFSAFHPEGRSGSEIVTDYLRPTGSFESLVSGDVPSTTLARMQQFLDGRTLEELRR